MQPAGWDPYANFPRARGARCKLGAMGRASGRHSPATAGAARRGDGHPVGWVEQRLRPYLGLEVVDHGYLSESYGGHPAGSPYVDITAASGMDRERAQHLLRSGSGLPELAWECGWRGFARADGQQVTLLRLFPTSTSLRANA